MQKALKWLLPIVIVGNIVLVATRVLDGRTALLVGGLLELLALALGLRAVVGAVVAYRRGRSAGLNLEAAVEDGLTILFPRPVARLVAMEPRLYVCLYRLARRRPLQPGEFAYHKRSIMGTVVALLVMTAPLETLAYEFLIPWEAVKWGLLFVTLYSILWVLGFYASLRVLPYRLDADGLRVYYGVLADGLVPYSALADAVAARGKAPEGREGVRVTPNGHLYLAAGGRTDVTLRLHAPVALHGLLKPTAPATVLHLAADDPAGLVAALRARACLPVTETVAPPLAQPQARPAPATVPPSLYVEARR